MEIVGPVQADPHSNARNKDMRRAAKVTSSVLILALLAVAILAARHDHREGSLLTESNIGEMRKVKRQNAKPPVVVEKAVATYGVQDLSKLIQAQVKECFWSVSVDRLLLTVQRAPLSDAICTQVDKLTHSELTKLKTLSPQQLLALKAKIVTAAAIRAMQAHAKVHKHPRVKNNALQSELQKKLSQPIGAASSKDALAAVAQRIVQNIERDEHTAGTVKEFGAPRSRASIDAFFSRRLSKDHRQELQSKVQKLASHLAMQSLQDDSAESGGLLNGIEQAVEDAVEDAEGDTTSSEEEKDNKQDGDSEKEAEEPVFNQASFKGWLDAHPSFDNEAWIENQKDAETEAWIECQPSFDLEAWLADPTTLKYKQTDGCTESGKEGEEPEGSEEPAAEGEEASEGVE